MRAKHRRRALKHFTQGAALEIGADRMSLSMSKGQCLFPSPPQTFALALRNRWIIDTSDRPCGVNLRITGAAFPTAAKTMKPAVLDVHTQRIIALVLGTLWAREPLFDSAVHAGIDAESLKVLTHV